jgi:hypothetical protein
VAFLTTRVQRPDEDDWGKLKRVLKYLRSTRSLCLTLFADSLTDIRWYVDASHLTHDNCKGHTGSILTFGKGATTSSSNKQKLPSKSSTESKLIGLYDKVGDILWTRNFMEAQGYTIATNIVFQDNMSTLFLAKNGHISSSKRTKHIKAKYFFIRHYHNSGEIDLRYCPTEEMWSDVLTNPLQGLKFNQLRAFLMNCPVDYSEDPPFIPSSCPTSAPQSVKKQPTLPSPMPLSTPTLASMKSQDTLPKSSSRGCVGTHGKMVTWQDVVAPRAGLADVEPTLESPLSPEFDRNRSPLE